jgi:diacylglycerol kinase
VKGCVRSFYYKITVFYVLCIMVNLVFSLLLELINRASEGCGSLPLI